MSKIIRNSIFVLGIFLFLICFADFASAKVVRLSSLPIYGQPKYGASFSHFDYVNPNAPKGGKIVMPEYGGFDNFNPFIFKGIAALLVLSLMKELAFLMVLLSPPMMSFSLLTPLSKKVHLFIGSIMLMLRERKKSLISMCVFISKKAQPTKSCRLSSLSLGYIRQKTGRARTLPHHLLMPPWAAARTSSKALPPANILALRETPIIGPKICHRAKAFLTLTKCVMTTTKTPPLPYKRCFPEISTSEKNISPKYGSVLITMIY